MIAIAITLTSQSPANAADLADIHAETEDLNNESDAAAAEIKEVKVALATEHSEAEKKFNAAKSKYDMAAAKRQEAVDRFNKGEAEIARLNKEAARLNGEAKRLDGETVLHEKAIANNKVKAEKLNGEIKSLQELRGEAGKRFLDIGVQRDKMDMETKDLEAQKADATKSFQAAKEQEKQALVQLEKRKAEYAQNKARTDAFLAQMRERFKEAQGRLSAIRKETEHLDVKEEKLAVQAKQAEEEVKMAEGTALDRSLSSTSEAQTTEVSAPPSAAPAAEVSMASAPASELTFKRKCKVFDVPARGAKVLIEQTAGASVAKMDEGQKWIAFKLEDGRKGFVAKACFH